MRASSRGLFLADRQARPADPQRDLRAAGPAGMQRSAGAQMGSSAPRYQWRRLRNESAPISCEQLRGRKLRAAGGAVCRWCSWARPWDPEHRRRRLQIAAVRELPAPSWPRDLQSLPSIQVASAAEFHRREQDRIEFAAPLVQHVPRRCAPDGEGRNCRRRKRCAVRIREPLPWVHGTASVRCHVPSNPVMNGRLSIWINIWANSSLQLP